MVDNVVEYDGASRRMRWTERFPLFGHNPIFGLACTLAIVQRRGSFELRRMHRFLRAILTSHFSRQSS